MLTARRRPVVANALVTVEDLDMSEALARRMPRQTPASDAAWMRLAEKVRELAVVVDLGNRARGQCMSIPQLADFFGIFNNRDAMFRNRKTWTIYE
jgi:hypothetical protein